MKPRVQKARVRLRMASRVAFVLAMSALIEGDLGLRALAGAQIAVGILLTCYAVYWYGVLVRMHET